jgi:hypothetical protein
MSLRMYTFVQYVPFTRLSDFTDFKIYGVIVSMVTNGPAL